MSYVEGICRVALPIKSRILERTTYKGANMPSVTIQEAQANLPELIRNLDASGELVITENDRPVARIIAALPSAAAIPRERKCGTMRGTVLYMAPDFDAPLDDFKE